MWYFCDNYLNSWALIRLIRYFLSLEPSNPHPLEPYLTLFWNCRGNLIFGWLSVYFSTGLQWFSEIQQVRSLKIWDEREGSSSWMLTDRFPKISTSFYHVPQIQWYYNKIDQIIKKNMNPKMKQQTKKSLTRFLDYVFNPGSGVNSSTLTMMRNALYIGYRGVLK